MSPAAKAAFEKARDSFDTECQKLSPAEYREYIDAMLSHVENVSDCWNEEHGDPA